MSSQPLGDAKTLSKMKVTTTYELMGVKMERGKIVMGFRKVSDTGERRFWGKLISFSDKSIVIDCSERFEAKQESIWVENITYIEDKEMNNDK